MEKGMRNVELDIMKGVGILLVMLGHSHNFPGGYELPGLARWIIDSFHVPLFFVIAGYFSPPHSPLSQGDWKKDVAKYFKRLVVPYLVVSAIVVAYNGLVAIKRHDWDVFLGVLGSYTFGNYFVRSFRFPDDMGLGPVWFLLALFWAKTLLLFVSRLGKCTCLVCFLLAWAFSLIKLPLPFMLNQGVTALGFLAVGYWCRQHTIPAWLGVLSVICWLVSMFLRLPINPAAAYYPLYPINVLSASGATMLLYFLCRWIKRIPYLSEGFATIGRNSMNVLCAHTVDMRCNALRIVLRCIPFIGSSMTLSHIVDYLLVLLLSFLPNVKRVKKPVEAQKE